MADKATDNRNRADDAVRELGEIDSLVNDLEDEIEGAAEDIARAAESGRPDEMPTDEADPIADAAEELDSDPAVSAQSVDDALEKVAAEIQADLDDAVVAAPGRATGDGPSAFDDNTGEDSIAAQIDEELARALDDRDEDDGEPDQPASEGAVGDLDDDDGAPADPQATDDAVHALAEALDRLLDDDEAEAEPTDAAAEDEPDDASDDDDDAEAEAPAPAPGKPAPAAKPAPKVAPAPAPVVDTETEQPRSFSPKTVLIGALALANKPFESLPQQVRETIGLAGLVTIFNAACLWVFLLLR